MDQGAQDSGSRAKSVLLPVIQLGSAGLAFVLWLLLGSSASATAQQLPIEVFAFSSLVALPLTLGLPYLVPNHFRGLPVRLRRGTGRWSTSVTAALIAALAANVCGMIFLLVGLAGAGTEGLGLTLVTAAGVATWIMAAQLARIRRDVATLWLAASINPLLPAVWLLGVAAFRLDEAAAALLTGASIAVAISLTMWRQRDLCSAASVRIDRLKPDLWAAAPMVPHLLFFAALIQGPRFTSAALGNAETLALVHYTMLTVTLGSSILGAVHSVLTVDLQSAHDDQLSHRASTAGWRYAALGGAAWAAGFAFINSAGPVLIDFSPRLSLFHAGIFSSALISLAVYYSISSLVIREGRAGLVAISSGLTLLLFGGAALLTAASTIGLQLTAYAAALLALPGTLAILATLTAGVSMRQLIARVSGRAAIAYLFPVGVILASWLAG